MPRLKVRLLTPDIRINSKGRKEKEYWFITPGTGQSLFIDGRKIRRIAKGSIVIMHLIDGKIDHFIYDKEVKGWEMDNDEDPGSWCEACMEEEDEASIAE